MRLHHFKKIRTGVLDDLAGKQHPAGFPADHPGPDHMITHEEIILRRKVLLDHHPHLLVTGHHDLTHTVAGSGDIHPRLMHLSCQIEKTVPGIRALFTPGTLLPVHHLVEPARADPVQERSE